MFLMPKYPRMENYNVVSFKQGLFVKQYCEKRDRIYNEYRNGNINRSDLYQRIREEARPHIRDLKKFELILESKEKV